MCTLMWPEIRLNSVLYRYRAQRILKHFRWRHTWSQRLQWHRALKAVVSLCVCFERRDEDVTAKKKVVRYISHQLCEGHDEYHDVHNIVDEGIKSEISPFTALVHELAHR